MANSVAVRPNDGHKALAKESIRLPSLLAVITTVIDGVHRHAGENLHRIIKIEPSLNEGPVPFHGVIADPHPAIPPPPD